MKIKTFLILTLLISFNYSVYSEDKKDGLKNETSEIKKSQRASAELRTIQKKYFKYQREIHEIQKQLYELAKGSPLESQNYINLEFTRIINTKFDLVREKIQNVLMCLRYENAIYKDSIYEGIRDNVNLVNTHSVNREHYFRTFLRLISSVEEESKDMRIKIQNTTAVISINKNLDLLTELKKWVVLNKKTPNKFKGYTISLDCF
jgi:hypothetical protein